MNGLLGVAERFFDYSLQTTNKDYNKLITFHNENIVALLSKLKGKLPFHEKAILIQHIENALLRDPQLFNEHLENISKCLGKSAVLAHILIVKEMESTQIPNA